VQRIPTTILLSGMLTMTIWQVPTFVIDERARFIRVNDALEALTGLSADELLGTNCKLLLEESAAKHSDST
jgi:PAS domain S-box-containing protein